jgi:hypothetical protein
MNNHAARPQEFGTGLRAKLEQVGRARERAPLPTSRDLVVLLAEREVARRRPLLPNLTGALPRHEAAGPAAA